MEYGRGMACCCSAGGGDGGPRRHSRGGGPCPGTGRFFSREAPRMMRRYRRRGLEAVQRKLLEGLTVAGVAGASVLEIGCGTGELQRRMLAAGAGSAVGIDVAGGMIEQAQVAAQREGLQERATFLVGDAVERAAELAACGPGSAGQGALLLPGDRYPSGGVAATDPAPVCGGSAAVALGW